MPTVTYAISTNGNDGHEYDGVWYPDGDTPPKMYAGKYYGPPLWMACRWGVDIPIGATIVSATWRIYTGADQNGNGLMRIQAHNIDDAPTVASSQLPSAKTLTAAYVERTVAAAEWGGSAWVEVDATGPVAEVLARSGRSAATNLMLIMYGPSGSPGDFYVAFLDYYAGSNPSELVITYTAAGAAELAGNAASNATATGGLSTGIQMSGAASGEATATGELTGPAALAGAATGNAAASGTMITWTYVTVASPDTGPGSIFDSRYWTGAAPANGDLIAYDATGGFEVLPNGQYSAPGYGSWFVQFAYAATPTAWQFSTVSIVQTDFAGDAAGVASATGSLSTGINLAGDATGQATASGTIGNDVNLAGAASGNATATGAVTTNIQMAGAATGEATAAGSLDGTAAALAGDAAGQSTAAGSITTQIPLSGDAAGVAGAAGDLSTGIRLAGDAAGESSATGDMDSAPILAGDAIGEATAGGTLTSAISAVPIVRSAVWAGVRMPRMVIGDGFIYPVTLNAGAPSAPINLSGAEEIKAALIDRNHGARFTDPVTLSQSAPGANWSAGSIVIDMSAAVTEQAREHFSKETLAKIEIDALIAGAHFTWFAAVSVVPGWIA